VGGIWGTIATGLFAEKAVNDAGANGLFFGGAQQFLVQCMLVVVTVVFAAAMTWIIFKLVDALIGVRVRRPRKSSTRPDSAQRVGLHPGRLGGFRH